MKSKLKWTEVEIPYPTEEDIEAIGYDGVAAALMLSEIRRAFPAPIRKWTATSGKDKLEIRTQLDYFKPEYTPDKPREYTLYKNGKKTNLTKGVLLELLDAKF